MGLEELEQFIAANSGVNVEFGSRKNAPTPDWIAKAEDALGSALPPSFRWFLENYGGGEIHGDEVYSIYQMPFDEVVGGDVVARTLSDRKDGVIAQSDISICATDFGELFVFDGQGRAEDGELPVVRVTGANRNFFAENFAEFIVKFVGDASV